MTLINQVNDEYFPRGGTSLSKTIVKKKTFSFGKKSVELPKKKKLGRRERKKLAAATTPELELEDHSDIKFERVEPLVYNALSEGTLVLCSVREIYNNYVDVCLPGRLSARLYGDDVSEPYNELFEFVQNKNEHGKQVTSIKNLFQIGQHLCCSVLGVKNASHYFVRVSSNPKHINNHLTYDNVSVGSLIQMAVQSSEDHGYMMYSGINGLTTFLPRENTKSYINTIRNFKPLDVGQILWCVVTKSKMSECSNTVHVSIDLNSVETNQLVHNINMDKLNPGVRVGVTINKHISQNLMVTVNESDIRGYIEPSQLSSMWSKPTDYKIGTKHVATVLYKFPYPRVVALTLKSNPGTISKEEIKHGTIFERAEVMTILKRGIALKLEINNSIYKGIVSIRRLGPDIDYEKLSTMFPIGNHIKCRVIGFDALEQVYSCTTEDNLLNERYLSPNDLKVGEIVEVTIDSLKKGGLEVLAGGIRGFVPSHHVADVLLHNPLDKFKLRSKQKAKVLRLENNNVMFTLRPTLVKTHSLLCFKDVSLGESYFGTVKKIQQDSITVSFFGNLFTHISEFNLIETPNKYTVGELVKCYVIEVNSQNGKPIFSLVKSVQCMGVTVGDKYDIRVKQILKNGLKCLFIVKNKSLNGFLPLEHMSDYKELCELIMKKYSYYSVIENATLFSVTDKINTFSIRKSVSTFFEENLEISAGFKKLRESMVIPASISEIMADQILVSVPIPGFNGKVLIERENLPQDTYDYDLNQGLIVKVTKLCAASKEITLTCNLTDKESTEWSISNVENFLRTVKPLQSVKIGTELECTVEEFKRNFVKVTTSLNILGIIRSPKLKKQSYQKGQKIKAIVLFHEVSKNIIYLLGPDVALKMQETLQTHLLHQTVPGTVIYGNAVVLIAMVKTPKGKQLAFIPTKENPNVSKYIKVDEIVPYSSCNVLLKSARTLENINYWIGSASSLKIKQVLSDEDVEILNDDTIDIPVSPEKKQKEILHEDEAILKAKKNSETFHSSSTLENKKTKKKHKDRYLENSFTETNIEISTGESDGSPVAIENKNNKRKRKDSCLKTSNGDNFEVSEMESYNVNPSLEITKNNKNKHEVSVTEAIENFDITPSTESRKSKINKNKCLEAVENEEKSAMECFDISPTPEVKKNKKKSKEVSVTEPKINISATENVDVSFSAEKKRNERKEKESCVVRPNKEMKESDVENTDIKQEKPVKAKRKNQLVNLADENENSPKKQKTGDEPKPSLPIEKNQNLPDKSNKDKKSVNLNKKAKKKQSNKTTEGGTNKNTDLSLEDAADFKWDATPADLAKAIAGILEGEDDGDLSQDSDDEKLPPKKMTPAEKRAAAIEAEKKIRLKEEELLQAEKNPQTPEHFERLLLGHPNSSKFWIMYMALHLEATEIDKARAVAKRAIKQINVRFEEERLNVWISRLNLEHFYGTPELFKEVLTEALKYNDEYEVYKRVLDIYAQSKNTAELENLSNLLVKKHKEKMDCWLQCQAALMKAGMHDKARNYLQRSLSVLPIKDHCTLISRFALIENKHGFSDQAQALFENLLTSYPRRVDLWSVYVDMLVKSGSIDLVRNVLERATSNTLPIRKMKALYQKWLKFEEDHGTPESVQKVKDAANDYVNNITNSLKQP